ncbi:MULTISPECIES: hypothetical protein [Streptomyces]|uniref:hypothetical protein n=1 Tax=Streptomyces sp. 12257 TaxID=3041009 RepID=UPI000A62D702|nr:MULTISPECIES: hypothetical protein [Streptomyces]MDI5910477.1 hypothetical protein [Streptomyces sp. 12257]
MTHVTPQPPLSYEEFLARATADPGVAGLLLKGSRAHDGMTTEHSDHDVYVILASGSPSELAALDGHRSPGLDLVVTTVDGLRRLGGWERYALARARVLVDRLDGEIAEIVAAKALLGEEEALHAATGPLDAYANSLYRSVKNARDGHPLAARLDAADSMGQLLELLFALDRRPRPYNKYLVWELERFPLPGWETDALLDAVGHIAATGAVSLQQRLFARVEEVARRAGHGPTLDAWGDDLRLMRPREPGSGTAASPSPGR